MCDYICIGEYTLQVFWCISVPLYIMVLITIANARYKKTKFDGPFWSLCLNLGFTNLIHLSMYQVYFRMVSWGYFNDFFVQNKAFSAWFFLVSEHAVFHAESLAVLLISLNRYTALTKPNTHERFWSTTSVTFCIITQWTIPWFIVMPLYPLKADLVPNTLNNNTGFIVTLEDFPAFQRYYFCVFGVGGGICCCALLFLYGSIFLEAYKHSKTMAKTASTKARSGPEKKMFDKTEFRLSCMVFVIVLFQVGIVLHSINLWLYAFYGWDTSSGVVRWWNFRVGILIDLFGYSNGYLLLLFSTPVRKQFLKLWCCKQDENLSVSFNKANSTACITKRSTK